MLAVNVSLFNLNFAKMVLNTTLHYTTLDIVGRDDGAEYSGPGVY